MYTFAAIGLGIFIIYVFSLLKIKPWGWRVVVCAASVELAGLVLVAAINFQLFFALFGEYLANSYKLVPGFGAAFTLYMVVLLCLLGLSVLHLMLKQTVSHVWRKHTIAAAAFVILAFVLFWVLSLSLEGIN